MQIANVTSVLWCQMDLNHRPRAYESPALPLSYGTDSTTHYSRNPAACQRAAAPFFILPHQTGQRKGHEHQKEQREREDGQGPAARIQDTDILQWSSMKPAKQEQKEDP